MNGSSDRGLLESVRTLQWPARRSTRLGPPGGHLARNLGSAAEFREYREYRQGDDARRLDWRLMARVDRPYIRLANDRATLPTLLVVDGSSSMAYPTATSEKWHCARRLALALAACCAATNDPVGLVVAAAGAQQLPPRSRSTVVSEISHMLDTIRPRDSVSLGPLIPEPAAGAVGRVAVISDFLGDVDRTIARVGRFVATGREAYALHVVHPDELLPAADGNVVTDPEDERCRRPVTPATISAYTARYGAWREQMMRAWRAVGVFAHTVVTSEPLPHVVRRIVTGHAS